jgi:type I restriction enzyme S subunit
MVMMQINGTPQTEFKETEIGMIPVDWDIRTIDELVSQNDLLIQNGFSCSNRNQDGNGFPHLRPMNIDNGGTITFEGLNYIEIDKDVSRYLMRHGDVLFNNTNSEALVGRAAFWALETGSYALSNHMTIVRPLTERLNGFFLASFLHKLWFDGFMKSICRRYVNQAGISTERLKSILIPVPPLSEQQGIAAVLNAIQDEIAVQDDILRELREFKRSTMQQLFTYGAGDSPAETKMTEIGEIPAHWEVVELGDAILSTQYGLSVRAGQDGQYPMLRMNNIYDGKLDVSDLKYVDLDSEAFYKFRLKAGDILFNRTNSYELVGKTTIFDIDEDYVFASYIVRVEADDERLDPHYLNHYFNEPETQHRLKRLATRGASQSNISATKLKGFKLPLAPIDEQRTISQHLNRIDEKIAVEEDRKSALQDFFRTMLQQLMTGQIRLLSDDGLENI